MIESEASVKGRVVAEMLSHFTNDLKIGKKIKFTIEKFEEEEI